MKEYIVKTKEGTKAMTADDIYEMMLPVVWRLLRKNYQQYEEYHQDLAQIALDRCLKAMRTYDNTRSTVYAYCLLIAKQALAGWVKDYNAGRGMYEVPLDESAERPPDDHDADISAWFDELRLLLNRKERKVLRLLLDGKSRTEVYVVLRPAHAGIKRCGSGFEALPEWKGIVEKARRLGPPTSD
ncbi:MAG: sigma-70 family RNA polymerase sigma factor [Clostridia bacterium]|nr:sigma-70 family RNA polymerase sigma factor [Clostridia bacterium]